MPLIHHNHPVPAVQNVPRFLAPVSRNTTIPTDDRSHCLHDSSFCRRIRDGLKISDCADKRTQMLD